MATGDRKDPFLGFNFRLELDGVTKAAFREISGLDAATDVTEYREGPDKGNTPRKLPGLNKYVNIVMKRGMTDDHTLWDWKKQTIDGKTNRQNGSIVLVDSTGDGEAIRWNFINGWPIKWTGPTFNATSNDVAIETLEIAHEGLSKA
jgi:phage tail-like protein